MVVDHVGFIFFPQSIFLRVIGRLTMPIMAFFAAEGFKKTRNVTRYIFRLSVFAIISEIPYRIAFSLEPSNKYFPSNVLFTILLGVCALALGGFVEKRFKKPSLRLIPYLLCMGAAQYFFTDWNWLGVLMIIAFYHAGTSKIKQTAYLGGAYFLYILAEFMDAFLSGTLVFGLFSPIHLWGMVALIPIFLYNGKRGCPRFLGYFFYGFYPLHLLILYLVKTMI